MRRRTGWVIGVGLFFVALASAVLLNLVKRSAQQSRPHPHTAVVDATDRAAQLEELRPGLTEPGAPVLLLGLDGLDWDLVLPWVEAGRMPNLARLLERGTWGEMRSISPLLSPLIWTTVATGVSPEVHGILDFVEHDRETGKRIPVTSGSREVPALWNIASALERRVDVVGYLAGGGNRRHDGYRPPLLTP